VEADLDNNPNTKDNVVVFSNKGLKKIKAIDGFEVIPGAKKENKRIEYSTFPDGEVRADVMNSKYRSDLKAWLRKYPTPEEQAKHPFDKFERPVSAFEIMKREVAYLLSLLNLTMNSSKNPEGTLTVSHCMTILQKLSSLLLRELTIQQFRLPSDYDFDIDEQGVKSKNALAILKNWMIQRGKNTEFQTTNTTEFLAANKKKIYVQDIPEIVNYINGVAGDEVIIIKPIQKTVSGGRGSNDAYDVEDKDLEVQTAKRAARAAAKEGRSELTKDAIYGMRAMSRTAPPKELRTPIPKRNIKEPYRGKKYDGGPSDTPSGYWDSPMAGKWGDGGGIRKEKESDVVTSTSSSSDG
jgi:hypothetical protein